MEPEELADTLKRLLAWAEKNAPKPESPVRRRLREHLGSDPAELSIISRDLADWDRPNFQVAVDAWSEGRDVDVVGLPVMRGYRARGWRSWPNRRNGARNSSSAPSST